MTALATRDPGATKQGEDKGLLQGFAVFAGVLPGMC